MPAGLNFSKCLIFTELWRVTFRKNAFFTNFTQILQACFFPPLIAWKKQVGEGVTDLLNFATNIASLGFALPQFLLRVRRWSLARPARRPDGPGLPGSPEPLWAVGRPCVSSRDNTWSLGRFQMAESGRAGAHPAVTWPRTAACAPTGAALAPSARAPVVVSPSIPEPSMASMRSLGQAAKAPASPAKTHEPASPFCHNLDGGLQETCRRKENKPEAGPARPGVSHEIVTCEAPRAGGRGPGGERGPWPGPLRPPAPARPLPVRRPPPSPCPRRRCRMK